MSVELGSLIAAIVLLLVVVCSVLSTRRRVIVTVAGNSMAPTLWDGDVCVARRIRGSRCQVGDIIVFRVQGRAEGDLEIRIKRVAAIAGGHTPQWLSDARFDIPERVPDRHVVVQGRGSGSEDSRQLGFIHAEDVIARVDPQRITRIQSAQAKPTVL